ncbi:class E sortase [Occultella glacieicola]|uniref:Class E sortase n=1 Tax=Occultella glacieicola TaxID=2518684 RepID=A0ABY2E6A0_9MICO|nr:class E sortase [Occultella glacieicola]
METVQGLAAELSDTTGDQPVDPDRVAAVVTSPGPFVALGRLQIPAIGLDVEVGNGVDPNTLTLGPGHWPGTPLPGRPGNAVLSGHRTTHTAPFRDLDEMVEGDRITVSTPTGTATTFVVTEVLLVGVAEYTNEVLAQPEDPSARELTLFACHPEGRLTHRIVVHAQVPPA